MEMSFNTELPIELECFLLKHGILESDRAPGGSNHAPVTIVEKVEKFTPAWTPEFVGQEPPF